MLIKVLAWLFTPPKKTRGRSGGTEELLAWLILGALVLAVVG